MSETPAEYIACPKVRCEYRVLVKSADKILTIYKQVCPNDRSMIIENAQGLGCIQELQKRYVMKGTLEEAADFKQTLHNPQHFVWFSCGNKQIGCSRWETQTKVDASKK